MKLDINQTAEFFCGILSGVIGMFCVQKVIIPNFFNKNHQIPPEKLDNLQVELEKETKQVSSIVELAQQKIRDNETQRDCLKQLAQKHTKDVFESGFEEKLSQIIKDIPPNEYSTGVIEVEQYPLIVWAFDEVRWEHSDLIKSDVYKYFVKDSIKELLHKKMPADGWRRESEHGAGVFWIMEKK